MRSLVGSLVILIALAAGCGGDDSAPPASKAPPPGVQNRTVAADYGQIYVYDPAVEQAGPQTEDDNSLLRSLDDAYDSGRFVGYDGGLVNIVTPSQYNSRAALRLEVVQRPPRLDAKRWDHMVEVPLPVPSGTLVFEASGGGPSTEATVRPATYRARISGRSFRAGVGEIEGHERYRIQLWPAPTSPPRLVKKWPGYAALAAAR
jgi:hypothetical protein